jgi:multidrug efflux pump subunit AcrA (membrane-fusion protein)
VSSRGFLLTFLFLFCVTDALKAANARIAALEAELNASREAWDIATTAKVAAEKTAKSAETKAKKAKKALADADQRRVRREQMIAKRLDKISVLVGDKCRVAPFLSTCSCFYLLIFTHFLLSLSSMLQRRKLEYPWSLYSRILKIL